MALSDRAAAAAPYAQQLLCDHDVQDAIRRTFRATRGAYARGRGRSARQAMKDKKLRRELQQALKAVRELWSLVGAPTPRRKSRSLGKVTTVVIVSAGGFLALNSEARERVLALLGKNDAKPPDAPQ